MNERFAFGEHRRSIVNHHQLFELDPQRANTPEAYATRPKGAMGSWKYDLAFSTMRWKQKTSYTSMQSFFNKVSRFVIFLEKVVNVC